MHHRPRIRPSEPPDTAVPQPRRITAVAVPVGRYRQTSARSSCEDMEVDEVHRARMLATETGADLRGVVLVEGTSDQAAVEALAARRGQRSRR